jgi:hypothetical protein
LPEGVRRLRNELQLPPIPGSTGDTSRGTTPVPGSSQTPSLVPPAGTSSRASSRALTPIPGSSQSLFETRPGSEELDVLGTSLAQDSGKKVGEDETIALDDEQDNMDEDVNQADMADEGDASGDEEASQTSAKSARA